MEPRKYYLNGTMASDANEQIPLDAKMGLNHEAQLSPQRRKKMTLWEGIQDIYFEYCSNSSLHGVQYLGTRRPWKEVIFWVAVFIVSMSYCSITIHNVYVKWIDTPVIVSFSEYATAISEIPFPAVTICSETRRKLKKDGPQYGDLLQHLNQYRILPNITSRELEEFITLLHTCNYDNLPEKIPHLSDKPIDYIEILKNMSIDFQQQMAMCKWFGIAATCDDLFTTTYTEDGLCFTFNGFNGTDLYRENTVQYRQMGLESFVSASTDDRINRTLSWSLDQGYPKNTPLKTYPARVVSANTRAALTVILQSSKANLDYGCSGATQGFKVALHTPDEVPLLSKRFVRVSLDKEVSIAVNPAMVTTSPGIANHLPEKRKCYLKGERQLAFYKVYSENNCDIECLTNYTLRTCGCVKYAMARTPDMPVCGADKIHCYIKAEDNMLLDSFANANGDKNGCNCMPSCISLEYGTEISQADFNARKKVDAEGNTDDMKEDEIYARLTIYFKDDDFITSKRSALYGFSEFMANCGGILGLFMGFSLLSVIEVLYHFSLRLWSNMTSKKSIE